MLPKALESLGILSTVKDNLFYLCKMKVYVEVIILLCKLLKPFHDYIFSWDSSSAFHHASCGIKYDGSPTGLRFGKNMGEFDFGFVADKDVLNIAQYNRNFIDEMIGYVV